MYIYIEYINISTYIVFGSGKLSGPSRQKNLGRLRRLNWSRKRRVSLSHCRVLWGVRPPTCFWGQGLRCRPSLSRESTEGGNATNGQSGSGHSRRTSVQFSGLSGVPFSGRHFSGSSTAVNIACRSRQCMLSSRMWTHSMLNKSLKLGPQDFIFRLCPVTVCPDLFQYFQLCLHRMLMDAGHEKEWCQSCCQSCSTSFSASRACSRSSGRSETLQSWLLRLTSTTWDHHMTTMWPLRAS